MTFPERKAALKSVGVSQADIARRTGFSTVYVHEVLRGTRSNPMIRKAIAKAIKQPVAAVFPDDAPLAVAA